MCNISTLVAHTFVEFSYTYHKAIVSDVLQMFGSPDKRFICLGPSSGFGSHYGK